MISKEFVLFNIPANTQKEAIEALIAIAKAQNRVTDEQKVVATVLKREGEGTTGFGKGIAIPHGKTDFVTEPTLLFGTLANGVDWNAMDGNPVSMVFLILVPESSHNEHLQILAKLARKLMHEEFVEQLQNIKSPESLTAFIQSELA